MSLRTIAHQTSLVHLLEKICNRIFGYIDWLPVIWQRNVRSLGIVRGVFSVFQINVSQCSWKMLHWLLTWTFSLIRCLCVAASLCFLAVSERPVNKTRVPNPVLSGRSLAAGAVFLSVIYLTYTGRCHHLLTWILSLSLQKVNSFASFVHVPFILVGSAIVSLETVWK